MGEDVPAARRDALRIDGHHDTLAAERVSRLGDQRRTGDSGRVHAALVRTRQQQCPHVRHRPNPAAHGQRQKHALGGAGDHVEHGAARLVRRGDVETGQLVGPRRVVQRRLLHGVAGVAQRNEGDAFDNPAMLHVETRDNPQLQHPARPPCPFRAGTAAAPEMQRARRVEHDAWSATTA